MVTSLSSSDSTSDSLPYEVTHAAAGDTIQFAPSLNGGTITLADPLVINKDLTIDGAGSGITVNGGGKQVFLIEFGATADINGLTITDGFALATSIGGGIFNRGTLSLSNSTVTGNSAGQGGGIFSSGTMTMKGDTVTNNTATEAIAGNGGGIRNTGAMTIINCTIAANHATNQGGGIDNLGELDVVNSTVAYNTVNGGTAPDGGGISTSLGGFVQLKLLNTIVFNPNSGALTHQDVAGPVDYGQGDLFGSFTSGRLGNLGGNQYNVDPRLGPLQNNGGPTATMALLQGSPAIGAGAATSQIADLSVPTTDQRGDPRPANSIDIGAFQTPTQTQTHAPAITSANNTTFTVGDNGTFTVTATGFPAPTLQESGALPKNVTFDPATGILSGTPAVGTAGTYALTFTASNGVGPGVSQSFTLNVAQVASTTVTISGSVFVDFNSNGIRDAGEPGLAGRTVFLDLKNSGQLDAGDPSTVTAADGSFQFTGLTPGTYTVREKIDFANVALTGRTSQVVTATANVSGIDFGNVIYNPAYPVYPQADLYAPHPNADATTAYVRGLYQAILGRAAEPAGLAAWVNALKAGVSDIQVATLFVNSQEHRQDEVDYYYKTFLGRAPDPASAGWVNLLMQDGNEAEVIEGILTSREYTSEHASNAAFVNDLYFRLLGRQADSGGLASWEQDLGSGVSRTAVVEGFLESQESAELASVSFYAAFLHRAKDLPGDQFWDGQLTSQAQTFGQVAASFFSAPPLEFQNTAAHNVP
jgi:hypothetical protein